MALTGSYTGRHTLEADAASTACTRCGLCTARQHRWNAIKCRDIFEVQRRTKHATHSIVHICLGGISGNMSPPQTTHGVFLEQCSLSPHYCKTYPSMLGTLVMWTAQRLLVRSERGWREQLEGARDALCDRGSTFPLNGF